jgi:hypothetical protein
MTFKTNDQQDVSALAALVAAFQYNGIRFSLEYGMGEVLLTVKS